MLKNSGGSEVVLFLPIINTLALPFLLLVNYSTTKFVHQALNIKLPDGILLLSLVVPVWSVIYVPLIFTILPVFGQ
jgi:hypothetical protein